MNTYTTSIPSKAEVYMKTLSSLDDSTKIELINLLSLSLLKKDDDDHITDTNADLYHCFHGDWGNDMSAEEYCKMLRTEGVNTFITDGYMYLLDTNVIIEMLHGNNKVTEHIYSVGMQNCCVCEMTIAELFYGAVKGNNIKNFQDIDIIRSLFAEKPIRPCFKEYAENRLALRQKGKSIDLMDLLIASVALHNDYIFVTHNTKHFERIQNLTIEDWQ